MKKIIALFTLIVFSISCSTDDGLDGYNTKVVGFLQPIQNVSYVEDEGTVLKNFKFYLLNENGTTFNDDITITYAIDAEASTATEGVEYDFVNATNQVVIPAGEKFGTLPINVNTGNFNPSEKTSLVINMVSVDAEGFTIPTLKKKLTINFVACQSSISGTYSVVVTREDGVVKTFTNDFIESIGTNYFQTTYTGHWVSETIAPNQGFNFYDICGKIYVEPQYLAQGHYTNVVRGLTTDGTDGEIIDANSFQITYEITFAEGNMTYTCVYTKI